MLEHNHPMSQHTSRLRFSQIIEPIQYALPLKGYTWACMQAFPERIFAIVMLFLNDWYHRCELVKKIEWKKICGWELKTRHVSKILPIVSHKNVKNWAKFSTFEIKLHQLPLRNTANSRLLHTKHLCLSKKWYFCIHNTMSYVCLTTLAWSVILCVCPSIDSNEKNNFILYQPLVGARDLRPLWSPPHPPHMG